MCLLRGVFAPTYADVYLALDGSFVERRVVPVVPGVGVGPLTQQQRHHLQAKAQQRFLSADTDRSKRRLLLLPFSAPPPEPPPTTL